MPKLGPDHLRGIYAILPTPFNADLSVDYGSLESIVDYCVACKVHGIVTPANASEQPMLMDAEREKIIDVVVKKTAGRIPVVAGVTAVNAYAATYFARSACAMGADALMAMPPYLFKASSNVIARYYAAIDQVSNMPIIIQNYGGVPTGTQMSPSEMLDICDQSENIVMIKEECQYSSQLISNTLAMANQRQGCKLIGIMGGKAGKYIIEEYMRGAIGNMPACEIADVHVKIWNLCEKGDLAAAQKILDCVQPLLNFEAIYGSQCYKEVLRDRGVISTAYSRSVNGQPLDDYDHKELDRIMEAIKPQFEV